MVRSRKKRVLLIAVCVPALAIALYGVVSAVRAPTVIAPGDGTAQRGAGREPPAYSISEHLSYPIPSTGSYELARDVFRRGIVKVGMPLEAVQEVLGPPRGMRQLPGGRLRCHWSTRNAECCTKGFFVIFDSERRVVVVPDLGE